MSREANIAAQEHLANHLNAGDVDIAVEVFAQDAVDHDPASGQGPGREGFRTFFKTLATAFPDAHIEPEHVVADDEHVSLAYTLTGTHQGDFQGLAATGKRIEVRGVQIGRFEKRQARRALGQHGRARHRPPARGRAQAAGRGRRARRQAHRLAARRQARASCRSG